MPLDLIINDESVTNDRGWKLLNSGLDRARYDKNPLLLYQHDTDRIIGHCTALRIEGSKLIGSFEFDPDAESQAIRDKATDGSLRGVSPGLYIRRMEPRGEEELVTEWELLEVSLVSLPSNPNAVKLYSQSGKALSDEEARQQIINLKSSYTMTKENEPTLTPRTLALLGLSNEASEAEIHEAITHLSKECNDLKEQLATIHRTAGEQLVQEALEAKKIDPAKREQFLRLYAQDADLCRDILAGLTAPQSLASRLVSEPSGKGRFDEDWDTLDRKGLLTRLKAEDPELFAEKFNERFFPHH